MVEGPIFWRTTLLTRVSVTEPAGLRIKGMEPMVRALSVTSIAWSSD